MNTFEQILKNGKISFYGYSYPNLPTVIQGLSDERVEIFFKQKKQKIRLKSSIRWDQYSGYKDTPWASKDIVFFDQDATKSLCVGFPTKSKFVMISLKYPRYYIFIALGLLRRFLLKTIYIEGIINLDNGTKFSPWLLIKCKEQPTNSLTLNAKIGINGFLNFLANQNIRYIVPRFYENLPNLTKKDADLDIIVDRKNAEQVKLFLRNNPGDIPIDVYTDNGTDYHGMSYVPPSKAKDALDRYRKGPGGSRIPAKRDELDLIIYHALYHKGYLSRLRTNQKLKMPQDKDNKYMNVIKPLSMELGIGVGDTLEDMDAYMEKAGWKPALDTLAKIAAWNEWVRDYHMGKKATSLPLYVLILKEGLNGTINEDLLKAKCTEEHFEILEERQLIDKVKQRAITELRGGIWNNSSSSNEDSKVFHPYKILVVWDKLERHISQISQLKEKIRKIVDTQNTSLVHSSDNYSESLEYIRVCLPDKIDFYEDEKTIISTLTKYSSNKKPISSKFTEWITKVKIEIRNMFLRALGH